MSRVSSSITPAAAPVGRSRLRRRCPRRFHRRSRGRGVGRVEPVGDEVERRPPVHLDRIVARDGSARTPARGTAVRGPTSRSMSSSQSPRIGPNMFRPITYAPRGRMSHSVAILSASVARASPMCQPCSSRPRFPSGLSKALVRPGDEAVQRDRHMTGGGIWHEELPHGCDRRVAARTGSTGDRNCRVITSTAAIYSGLSSASPAAAAELQRLDEQLRDNTKPALERLVTPPTSEA